MNGRKTLKARLNYFILSLSFITIFPCALPITVAFDHGMEIIGGCSSRVL